MRSWFIALFSIIFFGCSNNSGNNTSEAMLAATDTANFTTIQWLDTIKNLGTLSKGQTVKIDFKFRNSGDKPLYVIKAQPGCGCTVADYPKEAIARGKEGVIVAAFDTDKGSEGSFKKGITVTTNTSPNGNTILFFEGEIKAKGEKKELRNEASTTSKQTNS